MPRRERKHVMLPRWLPFAASALGVAALGSVAVTRLAARRWQLETDHLVQRLTSASASKLDRAHVVSFAALSALPAPVERYFRRVLRDGQPYVRAARIVQAGRFNMKPGGDGWCSFEATQFYTVSPPGYVWDARIRMAPLFDLRVRDAYVARHGTMRGTWMALVDVVNQRSRHELDEGALQRYLAEAVMFPTALLPQAGVVWTPIDQRHAAASLTDGATTACLEFEFAATGEILTMSTPRRYRAEKGGYAVAPWGGFYRRYEVRNGMRVPTQADVHWITGGRQRSYVTLRVTGATFDFEDANAGGTAAPAAFTRRSDRPVMLSPMT